MARTRARVRREESISESSAASASESEAATAAIPDAPSSTSTSIAEEPSASEDEDEAHRKLLLAYQTTTRPRRTKLTARKSASEGGHVSQDYLPPPTRHGERGKSVEGSNAKRPFRPARSARKTAQPASLSSSANKARPGPSSSLARSAAAARNAVGYTLSGATTSQGEVALDEETSDDEPQEGHSQYETAPASLKRRRSTLTASGSRKALPPQPDSDDEDEADVTMWVPVETGSSPVNTNKARQVPQPEEEEEADPLTIARKAREILEAAMKPGATPMTRQKKDTLSAFLRSKFTHVPTAWQVFRCGTDA